ncbi:MAG: acyl-CoA dehydrogenase family protein [Oceanicoccus sp.]
MGGHGYINEHPVEMFYRDNRLNPIHEGAIGIQLLDLLARKVPMQHWQAVRIRQTPISIRVNYRL